MCETITTPRTRTYREGQCLDCIHSPGVKASHNSRVPRWSNFKVYPLGQDTILAFPFASFQTFSKPKPSKAKAKPRQSQGIGNFQVKREGKGSKANQTAIKRPSCVHKKQSKGIKPMAGESNLLSLSRYPKPRRLKESHLLCLAQ